MRPESSLRGPAAGRPDSRNFLFCLEPTCGVAYTKNQRSEPAKLATLGVDNRSTATTILAVRSLIELQRDLDLQPEARNSSASLTIARMRRCRPGTSTILPRWPCCAPRCTRPPRKGHKGLSHGELSRRVFDAMQLPFEAYAADPDVRGPPGTPPTMLCAG